MVQGPVTWIWNVAVPWLVNLYTSVHLHLRLHLRSRTVAVGGKALCPGPSFTVIYLML